MPIPPQFLKHSKKKKGKRPNPFAKDAEGKAEPGDSKSEDAAETDPKKKSSAAKRKLLIEQLRKGK